MSKLSPCPFCGSEDVNLTTEDAHKTPPFFITCCEYGGASGLCSVPTSAIKQWNTHTVIQKAEATK